MRMLLCLAISLIALSACAADATSGGQNSMAPPELPTLGQTYGTTDNALRQFKWSNSDNTQQPNLYKLPINDTEVMLHASYSKMADETKRVSGLTYYGGKDSAEGLTAAAWSTIKATVLPKDVKPEQLSEIGGNLREIYLQESPGTTTTLYYSKTLAAQERKWHVHTCDAASGKYGLVILDDVHALNPREREVYITEAVIHYCGEAL